MPKLVELWEVGTIFKKVIILLIFFLIITGCSSTQSSLDSSLMEENLQETARQMEIAKSKINELEIQLNEQSNKINELEREKIFLFEVIEKDKFIINHLEDQVNNNSYLNNNSIFLYDSKVLSKNKDIFIETPTYAIVNSTHLQLKLLSKYDELQYKVLDENDNILNEDTTLLLEDFSESWKKYNNSLWFFKRPESNYGKVMIYEKNNEDNYVQIPIIFDVRRNHNSITILYPSNDMVQEDKITILGYASVWEGSFLYRVTDINGNTIKSGIINATTGALEAGIFATDIYVDIDSQPVIVELFESSPKDGAEINKVALRINYVNTKYK